MQQLDTSQPFSILNIDELEPLFKGWIRDVIREEARREESQPEYLSRKEVCSLLKISFPTLARYVSLGLIEGRKVGNRVLFSRKALTAAIDRGAL